MPPRAEVRGRPHCPFASSGPFINPCQSRQPASKPRMLALRSSQYVLRQGRAALRPGPSRLRRAAPTPRLSSSLSAAAISTRALRSGRQPPALRLPPCRSSHAPLLTHPKPQEAEYEDSAIWEEVDAASLERILAVYSAGMTVPLVRAGPGLRRRCPSGACSAPDEW